MMQAQTIETVDSSSRRKLPWTKSERSKWVPLKFALSSKLNLSAKKSATSFYSKSR